MNKTDHITVRLDQGEMHIYDFGGVKLHAYQTGDPLADEVFLLEKEGRFVVVESPCFTASVAALGRYLAGREVAGVLVAYHGAGGTFLPAPPSTPPPSPPPAPMGRPSRPRPKPGIPPTAGKTTWT